MAKKLQPHPVVEHLVRRPDGVPADSVVLRGLPGRGENGEWRLYQDVELSAYVSFREDDILFSVDLSNERDPLGGTVVWLKAETSVRIVHIQAATVPAQFLAGQITQQYGRLSGPLGVYGPGPLKVSWFSPCNKASQDVFCSLGCGEATDADRCPK